MILRGPRLELRLLQSADAERLAEIARQPEVARWWGLVSASELEHKAGDGEVVALAVEEDGELIGMIQFSEEHDAMYRHATVDMFLCASRHGRGLGREAVALVVEHLLEARGHHRITIDPAAANHRAIRCYEAVGFTAVGVMRSYERGADGTFHDGLLMELVREP